MYYVQCNNVYDVPRNGQTILDLALSSEKLISDMIPVERTLLVIGNKNSVSILNRSFID